LLAFLLAVSFHNQPPYFEPPNKAGAL